jgi:hypothetical protein
MQRAYFEEITFFMQLASAKIYIKSPMLNNKFEAASRYGSSSGSTKTMRPLAAPALQQRSLFNGLKQFRIWLRIHQHICIECLQNSTVSMTPRKLKKEI